MRSRNLGPNGSAVLTLIGYKQTDKQSIYNIIYVIVRGGRKLYKGETCYWEGCNINIEGLGRWVQDLMGVKQGDHWGQGNRPVGGDTCVREGEMRVEKEG